MPTKKIAAQKAAAPKELNKPVTSKPAKPPGTTKPVPAKDAGKPLVARDKTKTSQHTPSVKIVVAEKANDKNSGINSDNYKPLFTDKDFLQRAKSHPL